MGADIPTNFSFQSCQNPVNGGSWLLTVAVRAARMLLTLRDDINVAFGASWHLEDSMLSANCLSS